jgi:hypothetical protein
MARVLLVGIEPDAVDFTDPALPPGLDAAKIRAGIKASLAELAAAGHEAHHSYIGATIAELGPLASRLAAETFDCVVVGGGIRHPPRNTALFEAVLNTIAAVMPTPRIALVSTPQDAPESVRRALAL